VSTLSDLTPAEEHEHVADGFLRIARQARPEQWDAPSPVDGWTARDVVRHLVDWFPGFLSAGAGIDLPDVPSVDDDPVAAWTARATDIQKLVSDPGDRVLKNRHIGDVPLDLAIDQFYTADVFMHTWDLARAIGLDPELDPDRCERVLAGSEPYEEAMRASGQYGPRVPVPDDASAQDRMIGFIGRDPGWQPPAAAQG
jgi:uncharacterized protein (TIGR03086 family)